MCMSKYRSLIFLVSLEMSCIYVQKVGIESMYLISLYMYKRSIDVDFVIA